MSNANSYSNTDGGVMNGMEFHIKRKSDFTALVNLIQAKPALKLKADGRTAPLSYVKLGTRDMLFPLKDMKIENDSNSEDKRIIFHEKVDDSYDEPYIEKSHLRWRDQQGCLIKFAGLRDMGETISVVSFIPNPNNAMLGGRGKARR